MKNFLLALLIIGAFFNNINGKSNEYEELLEWAKGYSVFISDKIAINYTSPDVKNFYVKEEIDRDETIMIIPKEIVLNLDNAFEYLGSKTKKLYEKYKSQKFEFVNEFLKYRIQQSFLAYIMYSANKYKSAKNKFYQHFKYFFNTFESNMDSFPLMYLLEPLIFFLALFFLLI